MLACIVHVDSVTLCWSITAVEVFSKFRITRNNLIQISLYKKENLRTPRCCTAVVKFLPVQLCRGFFRTYAANKTAGDLHINQGDWRE